MIRWLVVAGVAAVLVGLVMVPLPGPGWPVVGIGIVVLGAAGAGGLVRRVSRGRRRTGSAPRP